MSIYAVASMTQMAVRDSQSVFQVEILNNSRLPLRKYFVITFRLFAFGGALHHQRLLTAKNFKICTQILKNTKPPLTQIMC